MAQFTRIDGAGGIVKSTYKTSVNGGSSEIMKAPPAPCTITVIPYGGATGLVQVTTSPETEIDGATATWQDWANGPVTTVSSDVLIGAVSGLKFIATGGAISFEVAA